MVLVFDLSKNFAELIFDRNERIKSISVGGQHTLFNTFNGVGVDTEAANALNVTQTIGTNISKTVVGTTINIRATTVNTLFGTNTALYATLTVIGRDSGARLTIPVQITKIS
jgi:hypothetical protein